MEHSTFHTLEDLEDYIKTDGHGILQYIVDNSRNITQESINALQNMIYITEISLKQNLQKLKPAKISLIKSARYRSLSNTIDSHIISYKNTLDTWQKIVSAKIDVKNSTF